MACGEALTCPTYYILSRRENYVWGLSITYGGSKNAKNVKINK